MLQVKEHPRQQFIEEKKQNTYKFFSKENPSNALGGIFDILFWPRFLK